jgi:hypothetical protein
MSSNIIQLVLFGIVQKKEKNSIHLVFQHLEMQAQQQMVYQKYQQQDQVDHHRHLHHQCQILTSY